MLLVEMSSRAQRVSMKAFPISSITGFAAGILFMVRMSLGKSNVDGMTLNKITTIISIRWRGF